MILSMLLVCPPLVAIVANGRAQTCQVPLRGILVQGLEVLRAPWRYGVQVLVKVGNGGQILEFLDLVLNRVCAHPLVKGTELLRG
jgi:hypothetical protein